MAYKRNKHSMQTASYPKKPLYFSPLQQSHPTYIHVNGVKGEVETKQHSVPVTKEKKTLVCLAHMAGSQQHV